MRAIAERASGEAHAAEDPATLPDLRALSQRRGAAPAEHLPGQVLAGRYRIERLVAQGAMGRVYLATQLRLDRPVAVKIMHPTGDPRFAKRFCREASIASQLAHPNIVSVYDYGESDEGELFMVMEYCEGRPLSEVLHHEAPFPAERVIDVAIQIARALKKAHDEGVVHRDLKPANIILSADVDGTDHVKVLDFGLVKLFAPESELESPDEDNLTRPGNMVGTPEYVSPEQALGDEVDGRADVYSLGVLMFQMIAGKLPFQGKSMLETITHHFQTPVPRVHEVAPEIECPMELEAIIRHAMAKARHDRYPSMSELLLDLKSAWRNLTDESFGTETSFPAITGARLPPIGLRELGLEAPHAATCEVDSIGHVAHQPLCLEAHDLALAGGLTPLPGRIAAPEHAVAPDPSEHDGHVPGLAPPSRTPRLGRALAAAALLVVALGSGAYWLRATRLEHAPIASAPARAEAPIEPAHDAPAPARAVEAARAAAEDAKAAPEDAKAAADEAKADGTHGDAKPAVATDDAQPPAAEDAQPAAEARSPDPKRPAPPADHPRRATRPAAAAHPRAKSAKPASSYKDNPY